MDWSPHSLFVAILAKLARLFHPHNYNMKLLSFLHPTALPSTAMCLLALVAGTVFSAPAWSHGASEIKFGVPNWPGVTVKTEVAAQLLEAMGYETEQMSATSIFIVKSMTGGQLDAFLGGWLPQQANYLTPALEEGKLKKLTVNVVDPMMGLAVPEYVWNAGVHSVADLAEHADQFKHKIYGIEVGSAVNTMIVRAIKDDFQNLGGWDLVESSTSGMLVQVGYAIEHDQWIVFEGWQPHWMNVVYNIKYLKPVQANSKIAHTISNVLTVVTPQFAKQAPQATHFLSQMQIKKRTMSNWILAITKKERDPVDIAQDWISTHLDVVAQWLEGVKTLEGKPAIKAVRAQYTP